MSVPSQSKQIHAYILLVKELGSLTIKNGPVTKIVHKITGPNFIVGVSSSLDFISTVNIYIEVTCNIQMHMNDMK